MKTILVAVTGAQGSGKSVFSKIAKSKYQIPTFRMGSVIIEECNNRGLEVNGKNMAKMAAALRFEGGPQIIAKRSIPAIKKLLESEPKMLIVDGIRSFAEFALLKEEFQEIKLVAIISSLKTRKQRVEARKRIDHETKGDFEEREERELGFGIAYVITKADYFILNENYSKGRFIREISKLLEKILREHK